MIIKKYKITSERPEETEFEVVVVRNTTSTMKKTSVVDENGIVISARRAPDVTTDTDVKEGISAVSIPSRTPAIVEILEKGDQFGPTVTVQSEPEPDRVRAEPKNLTKVMNNELGPDGRPASIDLNALMHEDGAKPQQLPNPGDIVWADED